LKRLRVRQQEQQYLLEGVRVVEEALRVGRIPTLVFCAPRLMQSKRGQRLHEELVNHPDLQGRVLEATDEVLAAVADTVAPQGVAAVMPIWSPPAGPAGLLLILDNLRDPGNMGTVLRSAAAAGVEEVLLPPGNVDPYNPKVTRSAMGALFRLPLRARVPWSEVAARVAGRPVWIADPVEGRPHYRVDWSQPAALVVGGEAEGVSEGSEKLATGRVHIPMAEGTESLNAATAASILLFEARRQRAGREPGAPPDLLTRGR
jgi:TrmH family RNA methyltransferase